MFVQNMDKVPDPFQRHETKKRTDDSWGWRRGRGKL